MTGSASDLRLLTGLVAAEHAAIAGYAVLGSRLATAARTQAIAAFDTHRSSRDALSALLVARGAPVPDPAPAYDVAVAGQVEALALAVRLEEGLSLRWLDLVGLAADRRLRPVGVQGLQDTAVRAAMWRLAQGRSPATVALPGSA